MRRDDAALETGSKCWAAKRYTLCKFRFLADFRLA